MDEVRWIKELEDKAEAKGLREGLLRVVRSRFPGSLSPDLLSAVERQQDLNELLRWMDAASMATDPAQFQSTVLGEATSANRA